MNTTVSLALLLFATCLVGDVYGKPPPSEAPAFEQCEEVQFISHLQLLQINSTAQRNTRSRNAPPMHMVSVTSCDEHQRWMFYSLLSSAKHVGQTEPLTWIRHGCSDRKGVQAPSQEEMRKIYPALTIMDVSLELKMPDGSDFVMSMLPQGMKYFMEQHPDMPDSTLVPLIDGDMMFLSKLKLDAFSLATRGLPMPGRDLWTVDEDGVMSKLDLESTQVALEQHEQVVSPLGKHYQVPDNAQLIGGMLGLSQHYECCEDTGPPRMASAGAWRKLAPAWYDTLVRDYHGGYQDEQVAFGTAYRSIGMEFNIFDHIHVDTPAVANNGWPMVEESLMTTNGDPCASESPDHSPLPVFFHMDQKWVMEDLSWRYNKYLVPPGFHRQTTTEGIMECDMPLLASPPKDLLSKATTEGDKRAAWGICTITHGLNRMLLEVKQARCGNDFNSAKLLKIGEDWVNSLADQPATAQLSEHARKCAEHLMC